MVNTEETRIHFPTAKIPATLIADSKYKGLVWSSCLETLEPWCSYVQTLLSLGFCITYILIGLFTVNNGCEEDDSFNVPIAILCCSSAAAILLFCVCCPCHNADAGVLNREPGKVSLPYEVPLGGSVWGLELLFFAASLLLLFPLSKDLDSDLYQVAIVLGSSAFYYILKCSLGHIFSNRRLKLFWGLSICIGIQLDSYLIVAFKCHSVRFFPLVVMLLRCIGAMQALFWAPPIVDPETRSDAIIVSPLVSDKLTYEIYDGTGQGVARLTTSEKFSRLVDSSTLVRLRPHHRWVWKLIVTLSAIIVLTSLPLALVTVTENVKINKDFLPATYDW